MANPQQFYGVHHSNPALARAQGGFPFPSLFGVVVVVVVVVVVELNLTRS
jgi:hypothetical protein